MKLSSLQLFFFSEIVAFTFNISNPAEPKVTQVTLGEQLVEADSGQKASEITTGIMKRFLPLLQTRHAAHYAALTSCPEFTVSFDMPSNDDEKFSVKISNSKGIDIVQPLSQTDL